MGSHFLVRARSVSKLYEPGLRTWYTLQLVDILPYRRLCVTVAGHAQRTPCVCLMFNEFT